MIGFYNHSLREACNGLILAPIPPNPLPKPPRHLISHRLIRVLIGTVRPLAHIRYFFGIGRHHVPLRILGLALVIGPHGLAVVQDPSLPWAQLVALGRAVRHRNRRRLLALGVKPIVHVGIAPYIATGGALLDLREGLVELVAHPLGHGLRVLALVDVDLLMDQRACEILLACAQDVRAQKDDVGPSVRQPALVARSTR